MNIKTVLSGACLLGCLTACSVPGTQLSTGKKTVVQVADADFNLNQMADVYPITPMLLQSYQAGLGADARLNSYQYRIGAGDVLNIIVWDHPELTTPVMANTTAAGNGSVRSGTWVDAQGYIFYPFIGKVAVAGKTLPEARQLLTSRLSRYIKKPQLDVNVAQFRSQPVYVMGEVGRQKTVIMDDHGLNLTQALGEAEGMNQNLASATGVFVIRRTPGAADGKIARIYQLNLSDATAYTLGTQFKLRANDVVYVTAAPVARWNRIMAQIMPSISGTAQIGSTIKAF